MELRLQSRFIATFLALFIMIFSSCAKKYDESLNKELINASKSGNLKLVKTFLKAGANPNCKVDGVTPLVWASYKGHLSVVKLLLEKGADINAQDKDGDTPLLASVFAGKAGVASYLVSMGASLNIKNKNGKTALSVAYEKSRNKIISLLLKTGKAEGVREEDGQKLIKAVEEGDYNLVQKLLKAGASPNIRKPDNVGSPHYSGETLLYIAVKNRRYELVRLLIKYGAKLDELSEAHMAPIHLAVSQNDIKMVKLLLDSGADINAGTFGGATGDGLNGETALMEAVRNGNAELVKLLIKKGADVNKIASGPLYANVPGMNTLNSSALTIAEEKKHRAIAQILINAGAKRINKYSAN